MEMIGYKENIQSQKEKIGLHQNLAKWPKCPKSQDATSGSRLNEIVPVMLGFFTFYSPKRAH